MINKNYQEDGDLNINYTKQQIKRLQEGKVHKEIDLRFLNRSQYDRKLIKNLKDLQQEKGKEN